MFSTVNRLGMDKKGWGGCCSAESADLKLSKGYSIPCEVMPSRKGWRTSDVSNGVCLPKKLKHIQLSFFARSRWTEPINGKHWINYFFVCLFVLFVNAAFTSPIKSWLSQSKSLFIFLQFSPCPVGEGNEQVAVWVRGCWLKSMQCPYIVFRVLASSVGLKGIQITVALTGACWNCTDSYSCSVLIGRVLGLPQGLLALLCIGVQGLPVSVFNCTNISVLLPFEMSVIF